MFGRLMRDPSLIQSFGKFGDAQANASCFPNDDGSF